MTFSQNIKTFNELKLETIKYLRCSSVKLVLLSVKIKRYLLKLRSVSQLVIGANLKHFIFVSVNSIRFASNCLSFNESFMAQICLKPKFLFITDINFLYAIRQHLLSFRFNLLLISSIIWMLWHKLSPIFSKDFILLII